MEEKIKMFFILKDLEDIKDVIFEICFGIGGDEVSLFVGDFYCMYFCYFDIKGFKIEIVSVNEGIVGGYNKIVLEVSGEDVYGLLKFEFGVYWVQCIF